MLAGLALAERAFREVDAAVRSTADGADGDWLATGAIVATLEGPARAILAGERVALNFLCHLSGIATATRALVDKIGHTKARICDTRKTTPGLRAFEKYAVRCGGGANHRFGLDDAILIKDNHIAVAGGVVPAIAARPGLRGPSGQDRGGGRHARSARRGDDRRPGRRASRQYVARPTCARR